MRSTIMLSLILGLCSCSGGSDGNSDGVDLTVSAADEVFTTQDGFLAYSDGDSIIAEVGDELRIGFKISNRGSQAISGGYSIKIEYPDNVIEGPYQDGAFDAHTYTHLSVPWMVEAHEIGTTCAITITVDSTDIVEETNEGNNSTTIQFTIIDGSDS